tara:strand:- start:1171 stop:1686 length:516 start_codon:yes stop_codon:yes gene_type:complete
MTVRPNKNDIISGVAGYQFQYGYAKDSNTKNIPTVTAPAVGGTPGFIAGLSKNLTSDAMSAVVPEFLNGDAFSNPEVGKNIYESDALFGVTSWFQLKSIKHFFRRAKRIIGSKLPNEPFPVGVDAIYVVYYFVFNIDLNPSLEGVYLSVAIPIRGNKPGVWKLCTKPQEIF